MKAKCNVVGLCGFHHNYILSNILCSNVVIIQRAENGLQEHKELAYKYGLIISTRKTKLVTLMGKYLVTTNK